MTNNAREQIAALIEGQFPDGVAVLSPDDVAQMIAAALPEVLADMVEPLEFEARFDGGSLFCAPSKDGSAYTITQQSNRLIVRFGPSIIGTCDDWSAARNSANAHYRDQCCAPFLKALSMKEGE